MPAGDIARFGFCSEGDSIPHELESRYVGADANYGEVTVRRCARCGRCWLHYLMEYEYLTASGRWFEGEIPAELAAQIKAYDAVSLFESMEWYYRAGSAFGGKMVRTAGPLKIWLIPFPGK